MGGENHALFQETPMSPETHAQQKRDTHNPTIKRARYVLVAVGLLRMKDDPILLNFFGDALFTVIHDHTEIRAVNRYTWYGHIEGVAQGQVILVVEDGHMAGDVRIPGHIYQIRSIHEGVHALYEIDPSAFPPDDSLTPVPYKR